MKTASTLDQLVDELGAHWTDPTLEILQAAGLHEFTVDVELAIWQTVKHVLKAELHWQRAFRFSKVVTLRELMEQVLRKASLSVMRKVAPRAVAADVEKRIRSAVIRRTTTPAERALYMEMVDQPALHRAFQPPSRTDYFPRLRVAALSF